MAEGGMISRALKTLPVGYRFDPTDEELIYYLKLKISGMDSQAAIISEVDLCKWEPWQLPELSVMKTEDPEWFFFSLPDYKYAKGSRSNRATKTGYWKPTGQDRDIKSGTGPNREVIGTKKTLVFYSGRAPSAVKTSWVIHEYRAHIAGLPPNRAYVLCRLKRKTEENAGSDFPSPSEAVALAETGIDHQEGGPEVSGCLSSNVTSTPPLNPDIYQGLLDLDVPSPSSFNFSYGYGGDFFNLSDVLSFEFEEGSFISTEAASTGYHPSF